ncbi:MAG TPA: hypothetical protein VF445_14385 [Bordetella sp.]|uniref:hypothetical protein n=1 Tax=Bordetella sp. TaxID=28081 RepID=UPI002ED07320
MQIGNVGSIGGLDLSNMDIETAMMAVQSQRTQLLDTQLASQIKDVQGRNDAIAQLNSTLGDVTALQGKLETKDGNTKLPDNDETRKMVAAAKDALNKSGLDASTFDLTTKGGLDSAVTKIKGAIDGQSNSQQMDMLRLQSLSNKRNEAFDVMTNFVKKMQDSRSSIIGNMR